MKNEKSAAYILGRILGMTIMASAISLVVALTIKLISLILF